MLIARTSLTGGYGTYAKPVKDYYDEITLQIESQPDRFMKFDCAPLIAGVRSRIAQFIGAEADECLFVTNTSTGLNTILRNFVWDKEDIIITCEFISLSPLVASVRTEQHLLQLAPHTTQSPKPPITCKIPLLTPKSPTSSSNFPPPTPKLSPPSARTSKPPSNPAPAPPASLPQAKERL